MFQKIVSKFGGTSMADATCQLRSAQVAHQQKSSLVVVSAASGVTNQLLELGRKAELGAWDEAETLLQNLRSRHLKMAEDLKLDGPARDQLQGLFVEMESLAKGIFLLRDGSARALDTLVSLGERMSSVLFVQAMKIIKKDHSASQEVLWLDAREFLKTDDQFGKARPDLQALSQKCEQGLSLSRERVYVTQGFIGSTSEGQTTTLGRGGSDYSAALFAYGVNADVLEIWTDVPGIATTDPRLHSKATSLAEISFQEASELATFGAKVLHPATLAPAMKKNIPVFVGSSFEAQQRGTWVRKDVERYPLVRALALRKNQVLVTLSTPEMLHSHGFLFRIFKVFNDHRVSIDAITTSEISVAMTLDDSTLLNKKLIEELSQFAEVQVESRLSLVSLIGNNINHTPGLAQRIFSALEGINVRMTCHGASRHNFCFLVDESYGATAIQRLHEAFIESN
ncbi:MAG: lysine-sensitive aspartokinase 3 [Bdellovibrionales bacterium]